VLLSGVACAVVCRQFFLEQFQQLDLSLFSQNRTAFPMDKFNYNNFVWAVASVRSRLHSPLDTDPVALVPVADVVSRPGGEGRRNGSCLCTRADPAAILGWRRPPAGADSCFLLM